MGQISLVVTSKVLQRDAPGRLGERQIAFRHASPDLAHRLEAANASNQLAIRLGGSATLIVGDTGAIWRSHNRGQDELVDALFALLSRRPDSEMRFLCDLE